MADAFALIPYKLGVRVGSSTPTGEGGRAIDDNFKAVADGLETNGIAIDSATIRLDDLAADVASDRQDAESNRGAPRVHHDQPTPSDRWVVYHNFSHRPAVQVYDTAGTQLLCGVIHSPGTVTLTFAAETSGAADLY